MVRKALKNKKGVTLIECVVAIAILSIICLLSFGVFSTSNRIQKKAITTDEDISVISEEVAANLGTTTFVKEGTMVIGEVTVYGKYITYTGPNGTTTKYFVPYKQV